MKTIEVLGQPTVEKVQFMLILSRLLSGFGKTALQMTHHQIEAIYGIEGTKDFELQGMMIYQGLFRQDEDYDFLMTETCHLPPDYSLLFIEHSLYALIDMNERTRHLERGAVGVLFYQMQDVVYDATYLLNHHLQLDHLKPYDHYEILADERDMMAHIQMQFKGKIMIKHLSKHYLQVLNQMVKTILGCEDRELRKVMKNLRRED